MSAVTLLLAGCSTVGYPPGNVPFASEPGVVAGCFADRGVGGGNTVRSLARSVWREPIEDPRIQVVSFSRMPDGVTLVRALGEEGVLHERRLPPAEPVRPLVLSGETWFPPFYQPSGEAVPLLGAAGERISLGLDEVGDLKLSERSWGFGLAYLVIPMAFTGREEFRFARIDCP